ncbi:MAG: D-alanine transaminase/branched-chain amino acid aminotransferase [Candidatus Kentron sp. G]|nr:MAG: D-alanine transaminase/branched-chain amino acid aminotransferase [Candidatus Kentron sp. G]
MKSIITILDNQPIEPGERIISLALYGYACFTTFAVDSGQVKGMSYHWERLTNDAREIFGVAPSHGQILENVGRFLERADDIRPIIVRVTVFPDEFSPANPEKIASLSILVTGRAPGPAARGPMRLATVESARILPGQKTTNMIPNLGARASSRRNGYDDALLINDGMVLEGAMWNIFFGLGNEVVTPPLSAGILPGVTRRLLLEHGHEFGFSFQERSIGREELSRYRYCFATNAATGIVPVRSIDGCDYDPSREELSRLMAGYRAIPGSRV